MEAFWEWFCYHGWMCLLFGWLCGCNSARKREIRDLENRLDAKIDHVKTYDIKYNTPYNQDKFDLVKRSDLDFYVTKTSERISVLETKVDERTNARKFE